MYLQQTSLINNRPVQKSNLAFDFDSKIGIIMKSTNVNWKVKIFKNLRFEVKLTQNKNTIYAKQMAQHFYKKN